MRKYSTLLAFALAAAVSIPALAVDQKTSKAPAKPEAETTPPTPTESTTQGMLSAGTEHIAYTAIAGTITVGATNDQDAQIGPDGTPVPGSAAALVKNPADEPPTASIFFVAYLKKDSHAET